jgi:hypothetical protein
MTRALLAAQSGWGKSWLTQWWTEDNLPRFDYLVVLDYKDEYRGLAKAGLAKWAGVGTHEAGLSASAWRGFLESNPKVLLARSVRDDQWREVCGAVARAARSLDGDALVVVDEAHFVAQQRGGYPDAVKGLATTGRGEGVASVWVTQRLSEIDETVIAQCDTRMLGGFGSDADLKKISGVIGYPTDVHDPSKQRIPSLSSSLEADDGPIPVRNFERPGSEWIYSTTSGDARRVNSQDLEMSSTHYGPEGTSLSVPG